jgi:hypothetical protein
MRTRPATGPALWRRDLMGADPVPYCGIEGASC